MSIQRQSRNSARRLARFTALLAAPAALLVACSATAPGTEEVTSTREAVTAADAGTTSDTVKISGTITDPITGPQAGITITLAGSAQAQVVTNWSGSFSFTVKSGGSYSITAAGSDNYFRPPFHSCLAVTPSIVNLNNLTQDTNIQFAGSGTDSIMNCSPATSSGANSGSLKIQGKVATAEGRAIPGVRVMLNGSVQGYRTTDGTGLYSFSVNPGSYSVNPMGACGSFNPGVKNLNGLKANATVDITGSSCPPFPLPGLCQKLDAASGLSEPATCNVVSTPECAIDREMMWAGQIPYEFQTLELGGTDCRFGKWQQAPISGYFTDYGVLWQQGNNLALFTLQLFGCGLAGNVVGPLSLQGSLIPPDLIKAGVKFTTADLSALIDEYMSSVTTGLADFGIPPLTDAEAASIRSQLDYAASKTPGVIVSSKLSFSTCQ